MKDINKMNIKLKENLTNKDKKSNDEINLIKNNEAKENEELLVIKDNQYINNNNQLENINKILEDKIMEIIKNIIIKNAMMIVIIINIIIFCIIGYKFKSIDNKINKIEEKLQSLEFKANFIDDKFNSFDIKDNNINNKFNSFDIKAINIEEKFKYFDTKTNYINDKFKLIDNIIYNIDDFLGVQFPIYNEKFSIFISLVKEGIMKYFYQKIKKYNLLYLASRDGFDAAHFHQKCDGKKFTVTLVMTDNNKIFGWFTELEWSKNNVDKIGNKGFIFSVNDNSIYYNKGNYKIYNRIRGGPSFYNGFSIQSDSGYDNTNYNNPFDVPGGEYVLAGQEKFTIKDYAVYQIEFWLILIKY